MDDQQKCTPDPSYLPFDPSLTPTGWDESAGFRETFLVRFEQPDDRRALGHVAQMLHEAALELARPAPPGAESATSEELRAVAADLRHAQGFLAAVARTRDESELQPADAALAELAGHQAREVAGVAAALEQALG